MAIGVDDMFLRQRVSEGLSGLVLALFLSVLGVSGFVWAGETQPIAKERCEALLNFDIPKAEITTTETVGAGSYKAPDGKTYIVPAFCRVHGIARPSQQSHINFEVWLPLADWSGRYYQVGNGGFAGSILYGSLAHFIQMGNVVAATDTGHQAQGIDGSWALGNPEAIVDYAHRAHKKTYDHAKEITEAFYGKQADYRYFAGCSTGGRQALLSAKRYYNDWDGILVGAPVSHLTRQWLGTSAFHGKLWSDVEARIPREKLPAIQKASLAACRPEAHVVDGIAADPRFCNYDPAVLACRGEDNDECLTKPQIRTLRSLYEGPHNPVTGERLYPGLSPTMEAEARWDEIVTGDHPSPDIEGPVEPLFGKGFYRYFVYDDPDWDSSTLDLGKAPMFADQKTIKGETISDLFNATGTDFREFKEKGGKLLMYFGWGDPHLTAEGGLNFYRSVAQAYGGLETTQQFFRLFMVPGMQHCIGGPGAFAFGQSEPAKSLKDDKTYSIIRALEAWVEKREAPETVIAAKYKNDNPDEGPAFTRPLCLYPSVPVYKGQGDLKKAENFTCQPGVEPN